MQYGTGGDCRLCRGDYKQREWSVEVVEPAIATKMSREEGRWLERDASSRRAKPVAPGAQACLSEEVGESRMKDCMALRTATSPSRRAEEARREWIAKTMKMAVPEARGGATT